MSSNSIAKELLYLGIVVLVLGVIFGIPIYSYVHVWNETGTVSWVGGKTFDSGSNRFVTPFTITVPIHGSFNFTTGFTTFCGNAQYYGGGVPVKGTVVELIKLQCGGYDLVVDP